VPPARQDVVTLARACFKGGYLDAALWDAVAGAVAGAAARAGPRARAEASWALGNAFQALSARGADGGAAPAPGPDGARAHHRDARGRHLHAAPVRGEVLTPRMLGALCVCLTYPTC